ncbi:hypothetical protein OCV58_07485 [Megasphaera butyrica]|uniref:hypothetical protein n=1 Tax=Megasphaera butyrica TaxID=2981791 RepID=UPI000820AC18|nr:hypothetical protein [Megasphaera butyrica]MCU6714753.1 hypothetical protein [Megasphaera butyrica]SCH73656.1 Uncharacterised protein [uncultured Megasphaera sp.]SCJ27876.1 Uncharacterised protein [uncultured Ruminococcus sp.]
MSDPVMKEVVNAEMAFTEDEIMRRQYAQREKALRDYRSDMAEARREEKSFIAVNMLRMGMDISLIAAATGLSIADVELLKAKLT